MKWTSQACALAAALGAAPLLPNALGAQACARTVQADVVALDQPIFYNRLGAYDPDGMMFALRRDVVSTSGSAALTPGQVQLRGDKRPRPLTLRMNVGDCLAIRFENLLNATPSLEPATPPSAEHPAGTPARMTFGSQPSTRTASVHVTGLSPVGGIGDDGSNVGANASSLAAPGEVRTYTLYGAREGTFLLYSAAATTGGEGNGGSLAHGLFGAVNVEPAGSLWYRSQVTAAELELATRRDAAGLPLRTPAGQPVIDYDATYPAGHPSAGLPILRMVDGAGAIVHADLTAMIAGPNGGRWPDNTFRKVAVEPNREEPFREFTVIFHDEVHIVQAFDAFEDPQLEFTLHGGRDAFAINYGTAAAGSAVLANRFQVGPAGNCPECKYEEFFLSSWAGGDPALLVDVPANATEDAAGRPVPGKKATRALYPDDPSNVYHSYINDRVKIRNLHAGPKEHHIFHLHAHQWLRSPENDKSSYMDSQSIGPGAGFTYEISHNGSGNRNKLVGDAIFHCHFYPHFAQGMWSLWRNHDVLEEGTRLDADGYPAALTRVLPDGEIDGAATAGRTRVAAGTPIPAIVPLPGKPLPAMPNTQGNKGYPFFVAGEAGHRAPRPPMDVARDPADTTRLLDGGLRRNVVLAGTARYLEPNPLDFDKTILSLEARELPENGTPDEQAAMAFHEQRAQPTFRVDPGTFAVTPADFTLNGRPRVRGAPFADPCVDDRGMATGRRRAYKAAAIQLDVTYNKAGWHFPQHRMYALWDDVAAVLGGQKAPEPLFMRVNSYDCVDFSLVNLAPGVYELDDFQVRSPTDVMGQHIHLVKFDVTSSDGGGNGFNYEDGSLAPDEVRERIRAMRVAGACTGAEAGDGADGTFRCPVAKPHPFFGAGPGGRWVGAQETVQRWYADDVLNAQDGTDRTLRTIFSHDHFGPSTHQQAGLYAGLLAEPAGSTWRDPETKQMMGTRHDGGPTSWAADILTAQADSAYREFAVVMQDFTLAYEKFAPGETFPNPRKAINPPGGFEVGLPFLRRAPFAKGACPNGNAPPCPEIVSADDPGTMTVNYRNEPLALRVRDPASNTQAAGIAGDLSHAFSTNVTRADPALNGQPSFGWARPLTSDVLAGDPFTPLMRAYEGDRVQIRALLGAHEETHHFSINGMRWRADPSDPNSGYRASQVTGLSEHFEFVVPALDKTPAGRTADYLYKPGSSVDDLWNGTWGILRSYRRGSTALPTLPGNAGTGTIGVSNATAFNGVCPIYEPDGSGAVVPVRRDTVYAVRAAALPGGTLVYNRRTTNNGRLHDPTAVLFVRKRDFDVTTGKLKSGVPVEPLILRANAGDCMEVTLVNKLPATLPDSAGFNTLPVLVDQFNANQIRPSATVGLHAQLVATDVVGGDGVNVGTNTVQTAAPTLSRLYRWYAGTVDYRRTSATTGQLVATPVEFGAINLSSSDPIKHSNKGAIGALIIEPRGSTWVEDGTSRAAATVTKADGSQFREFALLFQNDVNLRNNGGAVPNTAEGDDAEDSGQKGLNYRTEPMWKRLGFAPDAPLGDTRLNDYTNALSNTQVGGDPVTPLFQVPAGMPVRMRVLHPAGHPRGSTFQVHGHAWEEFPYVNGSKELGANALSEWQGARGGHAATDHFDALLKWGAGGKFCRPGDYLIRDQASFGFDGGIWGLMRVTPSTAACPWTAAP